MNKHYQPCIFLKNGVDTTQWIRETDFPFLYSCIGRLAGENAGHESSVYSSSCNAPITYDTTRGLGEEKSEKNEASPGKDGKEPEYISPS
jgi:hypothetical protein